MNRLFHAVHAYAFECLNTCKVSHLFFTWLVGVDIGVLVGRSLWLRLFFAALFTVATTVAASVTAGAIAAASFSSQALGWGLNLLVCSSIFPSSGISWVITSCFCSAGQWRAVETLAGGDSIK